KSFIITLSACLLFISSNSFSQDSVKVHINIINAAENGQWYDQLTALNKSKRIESIRQRLQDDIQNLKERDSGWTIYSPTKKLTIDFYCRPSFKINAEEIQINTAAEAEEILLRLNQSRIKKVDFIKP